MTSSGTRKRSYRLSPKAKNDLDEIWDYTYANWGKTQADLYIANMKHACSEIAHNPEIGRIRNEILNGLCSFAIEKHVLFYFVDTDEIDVIRILHSRMDLVSRILQPATSPTIKH